MFNRLKDCFVEIMNLSISYLTTKKATVLKTHDKYVKSLNTELIKSMSISHDILIEKYIGKYVIFDFLKGILYDYTKKIIEILNVDYELP